MFVFYERPPSWYFYWTKISEVEDFYIICYSAEFKTLKVLFPHLRIPRIHHVVVIDLLKLKDLAVPQLSPFLKSICNSLS